MISTKVVPSLKSAIFSMFVVFTVAACSSQAKHHESMHEKPKQNIVDIAAGNPDFSTLVAAVKAAGLVETLQGRGPFTVFAPTNEAFAKLPAGTVESLLQPENKDQLVAILTYHVVPGKVMAKDVVDLTEATTAQGSIISIDTTNGVKVDNANVVATDIEASNGVIHVIDSVIIPN
ncbi:fasciclin domain-containing protein [Enterovibrio norvegicus]|uniref:Fasciclin n=1 Tax=Enterovibrio norvegicus TaxID=188144 RepID=A0A2N7LA71_9GAMM|nr:fasciclin domain-containing protein [Enterovibrio norvegicus]PMN91503.1 fasciclin [Enterovibrio norvegicus]